MKLNTRARPHKYMKRLIKQSIREATWRRRMKEIAGMANVMSRSVFTK